MLIRYILFLSILFCLFSCESGSPNKIKDLPDSGVSLASEIDTFYAGGKLLCVSDTDKTCFEVHFKTKFDTSELNCISLHNKFVSRNGDTLIVKLKDKIRTYINDIKIESDEYSQYNFITKYDKINYYLLKMYYYEGFTYLMVNANTGKETYLCGIPAISPDHAKIAAACFDLQAGFVYNGIQVFNVGADSLSPLWSRELTKWGANKIAWVNNTSLLAEKLNLDSLLNIKTSYIKIDLCN